jgi:hypothetical protein
MSDNMNRLRFSKGEARLLEDGVIENVIFDYASLECEDVLTFRDFNQTLAKKNNPYVVLVESGVYTSISEQARKLLASREFKQFVVAKALIAQNFAQELVINFYLRVNKPAIETKLFTKRTAALQWLRKKLQDAEDNT